MANETAFPLAWPLGWKRSGSYSSARFKRERRELTVADALWRLEGELERLIGRTEADRAVISTNIRPTLRGGPRSGEPEPKDKGAAVYFTLAGKRTVLACDKWNRVADNIAAIAAHIECIRGIDRYGVGTIEQAFFGYQALSAPNAQKPWRQVLTGCETLEQAESKYYRRMKEVHPDMIGGNAIQAAELTQAIREARAELGRNGA